MTQLSDEILIAYGDGELDPVQAQLVKDVFAADNVALERFQQLQDSGRTLTQAFASMLQAESKQLASEQLGAGQPPSRPVPAACKERTSYTIGAPALIAAVLFLSIGAIGGYLAGNSSEGGRTGDLLAIDDFWNTEQKTGGKPPSSPLQRDLANRAPETTAATLPDKPSAKKWYENIVLQHQIDAPALLDQYKGKTRSRELALFQFPQKDIAPALIPQLKAEDLLFVGASPVRAGKKSYARLVYRDVRNGSLPVVLYVGPAQGGSLTLERGYMGDNNYVRWVQGGRSYLLVGTVPHWRLIVLSVAVQRQLVR